MAPTGSAWKLSLRLGGGGAGAGPPGVRMGRAVVRDGAVLAGAGALDREAGVAGAAVAVPALAAGAGVSWWALTSASET